MKYHFLAIALIIFLCLSCTNTESSNWSVLEQQNPEPQQAEYLFLEYWVDVTGESSGERCENFSYIDGPGYMYKDSQLSSGFEKEIEGGKLLFGCGKQLNHPVGSGIFSNLFIVQEIPFTPSWMDFCQLVTINRVTDTGVVSVQIDNESINLAIGESWHKQFTTGEGTECRTNTEIRLVNYGYLKESQIQIPDH
jgi:hypothetical protein